MEGLEAVTCRGSGKILQGQQCVMPCERILKNCEQWVAKVLYPLQMLFYRRHRWPGGIARVHRGCREAKEPSLCKLEAKGPFTVSDRAEVGKSGFDLNSLSSTG